MRNLDRTVVVTVTYGDRGHFLNALVERALVGENVQKVCIVSNASSSNLNEIEARWGARVCIIRLDSNTGSANGYYVGIRAALDDGAEYICLMDDDNAPTCGALSCLHEHLERLSRRIGRNKAAVLGFRPEHQVDIATGVPLGRVIPPRSSYFGFHFLQIPYKLWRRSPWGRPVGRLVTETAVLPFATYGGLLAHRALFEEIGLPERSLCLYADDTEYTWRVTKGGGSILLVTSALLEDLESSWNVNVGRKTIFERFLQGDSDFRAYYSCRNQAWFDKFSWSQSRLIFLFNRCLFIFLLRVYARRMCAHERLALLESAIDDGESGRLGQDMRFPLK
ncbi:glycosyltransferase [Paraburkholderia sp. GAS32]|uniref:glycosyltransferase n=1 Tax=Paraburkholderia sp. GAS32 TaxID=3035129 RepID=UPI003D21BCFF